MKLKELTHTTLFMKLNEFCCDWSEDDKFFVITSNGLDVFHLKPNPKSKLDEVCFNRSFLFPVLYYPTEHAGFDQSLIKRLSKEEVFMILYDPLLVPRLRFARDAPLFFTKALWSPAKIVPNRNCILALLTSVGGITLWMYKTTAWVILADISNFVLLYLKNNNIINHMTPNTPNCLTEFQERCYKLATSSIAWSNLYESEEGAMVFFVTIQKNGDVFIWKISPNNYLDVNLSTHLEIMLETNLKNVSSAHWVNISPTEAMLVLGTLRGTVHCLRFNISPFYKLSYIRTCEVWPEEDNLKVSHINSTEWPGNQRCVIIIKTSFFITCVLDKDGIVIYTSHKHLDNLSITSVKEIFKHTFVVSTLTGIIRKLTLTAGVDGNPVLSDSYIETDVNYSKWAQYGVCTSKNNAIWVLCLYPCKTTQREFGKSCSQLVFSYVDETDPMELVINNKSGLLTDHWDLMEVARVRMLKCKQVPQNWLTESTETMSTYQLKVCLWTNFMAHLVLLAVKKTYDLRQTILLRHIITRVEELLSKHAKAKTLSQFELETVGINLKFLKYCHRNQMGKLEDLIASIEKALEDVLPDTVMNCEWCSETLETPVCSQGHPRQWCCVTLHGVEDQRCLICSVCGCSARSELLSSGPLCTFCDSTLQCNDMFVKPLN